MTCVRCGYRLATMGTPAQPQVAVVVTTRNRADQLAELIEGLEAQTVGTDAFELVVVDDGSDDHTPIVLRDALARRVLRLRVIRHEGSSGAAQGREDGWRASAAGLIAFTDDDCLPERRWLELGLAACAANPGAIVQGRTAPRPDQLDRLGPFSRTIDVDELGPHFPTTNIFYPRELLERVGGFDTETYANAVGGEDTDLAWRAIEAGAKATHRSDVLVHHAVNVLGPRGMLRVAGRWTAVLPFARHPEVRRDHFVHGVFRKPVHMWLCLAFLGLLLRGRLRPLGALAAIPYLRSLRARGILEGGGLALAPWFVVYDAVEVAATARGAAQTRTLML